MLILKHLSDSAILEQTMKNVKLERKYTKLVLLHLEEVDQRRLYASLEYPSLFSYCVEELGYSGGAANRRVQGMYALRQNPEISDKIESGELTLTSISQVETFFRHEEKLGKAPTVTERKELFAEIEGKSTREVERLLLEKDPAQVKVKTKIRRVTKELTKLEIMVTDEFLEELELVKGELAHKFPNASTAELLLEGLKALRRNKPAPLRRRKIKSTAPAPNSNKEPTENRSAEASSAPKMNTKAIPAATRRAVLERAGRKCELHISIKMGTRDQNEHS